MINAIWQLYREGTAADAITSRKVAEVADVAQTTVIGQRGDQLGCLRRSRHPYPHELIWLWEKIQSKGHWARGRDRGALNLFLSLSIGKWFSQLWEMVQLLAISPYPSAMGNGSTL